MERQKQTENNIDNAVSDPLIIKMFFRGLTKYVLFIIALHVLFGLDGQAFIFATCLYFFTIKYHGNNLIQKNKSIYKDAADTIDRFLAGSCDKREWNHLLNRGMNGDYRYIEMQRLLAETYTLYPSTHKDTYCSTQGQDILKNIANTIRNPAWTIEELRSIASNNADDKI